MTKMIYSGSFDIKGPVLLELSDLLSLDDIINREWVKISEDMQTKRSIELEAQKAEYPSLSEDYLRTRIDSSSDFAISKSLIIKFKSNNTLQTNTFAEAAKDPSIQNELPVSFIFSLKVGKFSVDISLKKFSTDELSIKVTPEDHEYANDFIYNLKKWANSIKPIIPLRIWHLIHGYHWFLFTLFMCCITWIVIPITNAYDKELSQKAKMLLEKGIDSTNINQAIQILLAKRMDYIPESYISSNSSRNFTIVCLIAITLIVCSLLSFIPKTNIALGKGEKKVTHWKKWIRFLFFTIPSVVIIPWFLGKIFALF